MTTDERLLKLEGELKELGVFFIAYQKNPISKEIREEITCNHGQTIHIK